VRDRWKDFEDAGIDVLSVFFEPPERLVGYAEHFELPYPVASDPERAAYRAYGLLKGSFWQIWHPRVVVRYAVLLLRGRRPRAPADADLAQMGGDFLIDETGTMVFAHRSEKAVDRPPVDALLQALPA